MEDYFNGGTACAASDSALAADSDFIARGPLNHRAAVSVGRSTCENDPQKEQKNLGGMMKTTVRRILAIFLLLVSVMLVGYGCFTCSRLAPDVGEESSEEVYDDESTENH